MKKAIVLFLICFNFVANGYSQAATPAPKVEKAPKMKDHSEGKGMEHKGGENKMKNDLGLSAEQQTKFKTLNEAHKTSMDKLMADKALSKEAKDAQKVKLKSEYEAQVNGVFTPEQFTKWKAKRDNRDAQKNSEKGHKGKGNAAHDKEKAPNGKQ